MTLALAESFRFQAQHRLQHVGDHRLAAGVDGTYGDVRLYAVLATVADKATGDGDGDRTTSQEKRFLSALISLMEARGCALSGDDRAKLAEIRANVLASVCL